MEDWVKTLELVLEETEHESVGQRCLLHAPRALATRRLFAQNTLIQCFYAEDAAAYMAQGDDVAVALPKGQKFDQIIIRATQNKAEMRGLLAYAAFIAEANARIILAQANDQGAKSLEKEIKQAFHKVKVITKHKCRGFCVDLSGGSDFKLLKQWQDEAQPYFGEEIGFWSQAGLFGWDKIDRGSSLLMEILQQNNANDLAGDVADFGCGYGFLSQRALALAGGKIASMTMVDHDLRALNAAKMNLADYDVSQDYVWRDLTQELTLDRKMDCIIMNPPFHDGKKGDPMIGLQFIENAARCLKKDGRLYMVANKHLPYEDQLRRLFGESDCIAERDGFKVIKGQK